MKVKIGKGIELDVDTERLMRQPAVWEHIVYLGLRNRLMDSHASAKRDDYDSDASYVAASKAMAEKTLAGMFEGKMRTNVGTTRTFDPVEQAALRMARTFVYSRAMAKDKATWFAAWSKATGLPFGTEDEIKALKAEAIKRRAANAEVVAAAKAEVEAESALVVDTGGL